MTRTTGHRDQPRPGPARAPRCRLGLQGWHASGRRRSRAALRCQAELYERLGPAPERRQELRRRVCEQRRGVGVGGVRCCVLRGAVRRRCARQQCAPSPTSNTLRSLLTRSSSRRVHLQGSVEQGGAGGRDGRARRCGLPGQRAGQRGQPHLQDEPLSSVQRSVGRTNEAVTHAPLSLTRPLGLLSRSRTTNPGRQ